MFHLLRLLRWAMGPIFCMGVGVGVAAAQPPPGACAWECRNSIEVSCEQGGQACSSAQAFTPFHIGLACNGGVSFCAYSGCWSGQAQRWRTGKHQVWSANSVPWNHSGGSSGTFVVAVERQTGAGMVLGEGYATPLMCSAAPASKQPSPAK